MGPVALEDPAGPEDRADPGDRVDPRDPAVPAGIRAFGGAGAVSVARLEEEL